MPVFQGRSPVSELKSVALWHPDEKIFASWHDWFSSRGWMVIDVGEVGV